MHKKNSDRIFTILSEPNNYARSILLEKHERRSKELCRQNKDDNTPPTHAMTRIVGTYNSLSSFKFCRLCS